MLDQTLSKDKPEEKQALLTLLKQEQQDFSHRRKVAALFQPILPTSSQREIGKMINRLEKSLQLPQTSFVDWVAQGSDQNDILAAPLVRQWFS